MLGLGFGLKIGLVLGAELVISIFLAFGAGTSSGFDDSLAAVAVTDFEELGSSSDVKR